MKERSILFKNGQVLQDRSWKRLALLVSGRRIEGVGSGFFHQKSLYGIVNARGCYVVPGWIDLHLHADRPGDFFKNLSEISKSHAAFGTTRFLATFCASSLEQYRYFGRGLKEFAHELPGAKILGGHIEGPFINPSKAGAQPRRWIRKVDLNLLSKIIRAFEGSLKIVTLAPELDGIDKVIAELRKKKIVVSLGHTDSGLDDARRAIEKGARYTTHLFNQMRPMHHRDPGVTLAALMDDRMAVELIADGYHLHPDMLPLVLKLKKWEKIVLATDCFVKLGKKETQAPPRLSDGTLAGSSLSLRRAVLNLVKFSGSRLEDVLACVTTSPSGVLGMSDRFGRLSPGFMADIVILNHKFEVQMTMVEGKLVYCHPKFCGQIDLEN